MTENWQISSEERAKHDDQFSRLHPINGFITGVQAREFFLKSTLPPAILGTIWSLADINRDGRMDKKEFSIAMYLIKKKLNGFDLPNKLPVSLTFDPPPARKNSFTLRNVNMSPAFQTVDRGSPVFQSGYNTLPSSFNHQNVSPVSSVGSSTASIPLSEWPISQKLKFKQLFNSHDTRKRGYLTGQDARVILSHTGLNPAILAQIWSLSDVDSDGKLTSEEFCVAMHLVEVAKTGVMLPNVLPPELVPPSFRQKTNQSNLEINSNAGFEYAGEYSDVQRTYFDALSYGSPLKDTSAFAESFEDRRKLNFEKGAEELEKRRAALREQQQRENERREANERAEREKIERARMEAEMKRQEELERQYKKQMQIEMEKEAAHKRAIEQRENARKELEKQRQLEWQNQRLEQLKAETLQQSAALRQLHDHIATINLDLESIGARKSESQLNINNTRESIHQLTLDINKMRQCRDSSFKDIEDLQEENSLTAEKLQNLQAQRFSLQSRVAAQKGSLEEGIKSVKRNIDEREKNIGELNNKLKEVQNNIVTKKEEVEKQKSDVTLFEAKNDTVKNDVLTNTKTNFETDKFQWTNETDIQNNAVDLFGNSPWGNDNDLNWTKDATGNQYGNINSNEFPSNNTDPFGSIFDANKKDELKSNKTEDYLLYKVKFDFTARHSDELTINVSEIIKSNENMQNGVDNDWMNGMNSNGQTGIFPLEFVEPYTEKNESSNNKLNRKLSFNDNIRTIPIAKPESKTLQTKIYEPNISRFKATYAYNSDIKGDLTFNQGDIIIVTKEEEQWWSGYLEKDPSKEGMFPWNYVEPIIEEFNEENEYESVETVYANSVKPLNNDEEISKLSANDKHKPDIVVSIAPFKGTGKEQLSFEVDQNIQVRKKAASGWWEGELLGVSGRKIGWFPASYAKLLENSNIKTPSVTSSREPTPAPHPIPNAQPPKAPSTAVVLYNYSPRHSDEIELIENTTVRIIDKQDSDWWKGENSSGQIGVFPSTYVQEQSSSEFASYDKDEASRQKVIQEIIQTEESHLADLKRTKDSFIEPLKAVMTEEDEKILFVNWNELIVSSTKLVQAFRVRKTLSQEQSSVLYIADVLCENIQHMMMQPYIRYCSCQLRARGRLQTLTNTNTKFAQLLHECEMKQQNLSIESFLLKPMQKVTRYPLLINRLVQATDRKHGEYNQLTEALIAANELCSTMNQAVKEQDNSDKLEWIDSRVSVANAKLSFNSITNCLGPRRYLYSGSLFKTKSGKELVGFLFNDFMLLTTPQKSFGSGIGSVFSFDTKELTENNTFKMYKSPILLNDVIVICGDDQFTFLISYITGELIFNLRATSTVERDKWISLIKAAAEHYRKTERKKLERSHSVKRTAALGRVLIKIIEGIDLCPGPNGQCDAYCELSMGSHDQRTKVIYNTTNPKWNKNMQVEVRDLKNEKLCFSIYHNDPYAPNAFLGRTEVRVSDLLPKEHAASTKTPIGVQQKLKLLEAKSGELMLKLDLQLY